jgi:phytoene synthase
MMDAVEQSYAWCRNVARARARNFYYSFVLLSKPQRAAMCAIYAFMRYCDDLSDEPGATRSAIERWRADLDAALQGRFAAHPVWPAFHDAVNRFHIPHRYFHEMIDGVASDLDPRRFETFDELYRYCYQVASVVGLTTVHIFGFESPAALPLAEKCGIAFQLTNILRDIREDLDRGRLYLPLEDLHRFGVTEQDLRAANRTPAFFELMRFEAARAQSYYRESRPLLALVHRESRSSLSALIGIYQSLLTRIERENFDIFTHRVRLSAPQKSWIVLRSLFQ